MFKVLLSCAMLLAVPAHAVTVDLTVCDKTDVMLGNLYSKGFQRVFIGLAGPYIFSTWGSEDLGWATLVSMQDGTSCVVASGNDFVVSLMGDPV